MGDVVYGVIGGLVSGIGITLIVLSGRESRLHKRIRQETNRADTWRRNYCYLQTQIRREDEAERQAAVSEAEAIVTNAWKGAA